MALVRANKIFQFCGICFSRLHPLVARLDFYFVSCSSLELPLFFIQSFKKGC